LYIVASGAVKVRLPDGTHIELGSGEFFGELYIMAKEKLDEFEVRSLGYSKLLCLPIRDFEAMLSRDPALRESIELVAKQRMRALEVWRSQPTSLPTPTPEATPPAARV
jgi:CPA1 family monovalent cation:H+ antiporter